MAKVRYSWWQSYSVAVLAVVLALLLTLLLNSLMGKENPFLLFFIAVIVSAWSGGLGLFVMAGVLIAAAQSHQETLRQTEELYGLMVENVKDYAIFRLNLDASIATWNVGAQSIFGYQSVEIIGQPFSRLFPPEDIQSGQPERELQTATATGRADDKRWHIRQDGTQFWANGSLTALRDEAGTLRGFAKVLRDMTEDKQAEEALKESEQRFQRAIVDAPYPVMIHAEDGEVLQISTAWIELTGYAQSEIATIADWTEKAYGQRKELVKTDIDRLYNLEARVHEGEYVITTSCGETKTWDFSSAPLGQLPDGRRLVISMAMDITERKLVESASKKNLEELIKLNRLKDDFLSTVSHELRTPMTNMKMAIHLLKMATGGQAREKYLEILGSECEREVKLINDLLDLQRLEATSYQLSLEPVSLPDWLPSIIEPFRSRSQSRQQTLLVYLTSNLPPLLSDSASLGRILAELLNNACKYTPAGGEITLSIRYDQKLPTTLTPDSPPVTIFSIRNQVEIPASELPRIFEKFYRANHADPWKQGGTGLGLALVQKLVECLGGTILVESFSGWTTFTVELPEQF